VIVDTDSFKFLYSEILHRGGLFRFQARGCSMSPFVHDGAVITVAPVGAGAVRFGDVVFCSSKGRAVVHRVVGKCMLNKEPALLIRGDNVSSKAERFLAAEVIGKVVTVEQCGKTVRLNHGLLRVTGLIWAAFPRLGRFLRMIKDVLRTVAIQVVPLLQSFRIYRLIANAIIGRRVKYRTATARDAPEISRLLGYWTVPELSDPMGMALEKIEGTTGPSHVLIATLRERIVGTIVIQRFAGIIISGPDWWISEVRVRVRYQGAGIGRGLIIKALLKARQSGAKGLGGDVSEQNTKSVAMCENLHGRQMKPQEYSRIFAETSHYKPDQHIIFNRPIEELIQELQIEGVLDRYRGTGCLDQS
jgi:GNAT superfamily N-acetyltransferase